MLRADHLNRNEIYYYKQDRTRWRFYKEAGGYENEIARKRVFPRLGYKKKKK